ncbi:phytoene desaturase family protein [Gordonia jacobaea]|uniref:phytoene desaturase family protein n=1 Tax=Gordonia jacobaea TaxID=122202 RepID=UPI003D753873
MPTAVVVGAGPNGLSAAVRLAQAGLDVTVLEGADTIGGGTRSGPFDDEFPEIIVDHCSAFHPLGSSSPYLRTLPLAEHGLRWSWPDIDCAHPRDDGSAALLFRDIERTAAGFADAGFPGAGDRWIGLLGTVSTHFPEIADDVLSPMLALPQHPLLLARFGLPALMPATALARFLGPHAGALFTGMAAHGFTRLDLPGSSAAGLMLTAAGHHGGWPVAVGGSSAITTALAGLLRSLGGTIETGHTVSDLAQIPADIVILDVMPGSAADILGARQPARVARSYRRWRRGSAAFKVDYVIDDEVGWTARDCARAGTVHVGGEASDIAKAEADVVAGRMPRRPFTLVGQQWVADESRASGSLKPLWAYAHVPQGYSGDATEYMTSQIERFAPGFRKRIVAVRATTPAELERSNPNYPGGDIGGGRNDLVHLVARPRLTPSPYSTGVDGVYLCSAATPPGGGAHGMCGFGAAQAALAGLR